MDEQKQSDGSSNEADTINQANSDSVLRRHQPSPRPAIPYANQDTAFQVAAKAVERGLYGHSYDLEARSIDSFDILDSNRRNLLYTHSAIEGLRPGSILWEQLTPDSQGKVSILYRNMVDFLKNANPQFDFDIIMEGAEPKVLIRSQISTDGRFHIVNVLKGNYNLVNLNGNIPISMESCFFVDAQDQVTSDIISPLICSGFDINVNSARHFAVTYDEKRMEAYPVLSSRDIFSILHEASHCVAYDNADSSFWIQNKQARIQKQLKGKISESQAIVILKSERAADAVLLHILRRNSVFRKFKKYSPKEYAEMLEEKNYSLSTYDRLKQKLE